MPWIEYLPSKPDWGVAKYEQFKGLKKKGETEKFHTQF